MSRIRFWLRFWLGEARYVAGEAGAHARAQARCDRAGMRALLGRMLMFGLALFARSAARLLARTTLIGLVLVISGLFSSPGLQTYINRSGSWKAVGRAALGSAVYDPLTFSYGAIKSYKPVHTDGPDSTAGIPYGSPDLTVNNGTSGTLTISAGGTYDLIDFRCMVVIATDSPVRFSRCLFEGNATNASNRGLVFIGTGVTHGSKNVKFFDCEFEPSTPSVWWDAVMYHDFELHRCYIRRGTVDGVGAYTSGGATETNVGIYGCHIEKLVYFSPDYANHASSGAPYGVHSDIIQWQGGLNLVVWGNFFDGTYDPTLGDVAYTSAAPNASGGGPNNPTAAAHEPGWNTNSSDLATWGEYLIDGAILQINNNTSTCGGLDWDTNWCRGAQRTITMSNAVTGTNTVKNTIQERNNRSGVAFNIQTGAPITLTNNKYSDDGLTQSADNVVVNFV